MFEYWMDSDLKKLPAVKRLGNVFSADSGANLIGVRVFDDGEEVTLNGTVSANVIRADGETITVSGSKNGNTAYVVLPQDAYEVKGLLKVVIKITNGSTVTGLGAVEGYVYQTMTSEVVS